MRKKKKVCCRRRKVGELTFHNRLEIVRPVPVTREVLVYHDTGLELAFEQITFVQEHDHGRLGQELGCDDGSPEDEGILETIDFGVLCDACVWEKGFRRYV
jgi:hypothetical protein